MPGPDGILVLPTPKGTLAAVTLRWGPDGELWDVSRWRSGDLSTNRLRRNLSALGLGDRQLCRVRQVHGNIIVRVGPEGENTPAEADGLVTNERSVALVTLHADCYPVFLLSPLAIGLLHAGWRGVAAGIAEQGLRSLIRLGAQPRDIVVAFGPGIGPCCYTFGGPERTSFLKAFGDRAFQADRLDLHRCIVVQLLKAGLPEENIGPRPPCTACNWHLFFSHRREGPCGRFAAIAALL